MRTQILCAVVAFAGCDAVLAASVAAKDIKIPETHPVVSMQVPDDWTVRFTEAGLEATAPETNSFLFATILTRQKDDPNRWVAQRLASLRAHGVVFASSKAAPPATTPTKAPDLTETMPPVSLDPNIALAPPARPAESKPLEATPPDAETSQSSPVGINPVEINPVDGNPVDGKPVEPKPTETKATETKQVDAKPAGSATVLDPAKTPVAAVFPRRVFPYKNTAVDGKPVAVELLTYKLPTKSVLFVLQESGLTDDRIVAIINSIKTAN